MASAWPFVSEAEKRQPREPVQATSPARRLDARQSRPIFRCAPGLQQDGLRECRRSKDFARRSGAARRRRNQCAMAASSRICAEAFCRLAEPRRCRKARPASAHGRRHGRDGPAAGAPRCDPHSPARACGRACLRPRSEIFKAPGIEQIFEPRLGAIGTIAMVDEDFDDGGRRPLWHPSAK